MANVELLEPERTPIFRKLAIGTWRTEIDAQVHGALSLRAEPVLAFIEEFRRDTGLRLTLTHVVAKATALALRKMPEANALLRFGMIYQRKHVSVFLQVAMVDPVTGKPDLSGTTLHDVDRMDLKTLVEATERNVRSVKLGEDKALAKSRSTFGAFPGWAMGYVLRLMSFLLYTLNIDLSWAGVPKDGFGSVMITNIGSLGLESAFVPLVPWSRVPMVLAVGRAQDEPVVENGAVVPGKVMKLCATFDHRFIDGAHAAVLAKTITEIFANPKLLLEPNP